MKCFACETKLRKDNKIGACRAHRNLSENRKLYMKKYAGKNKESISEYKKEWQKVNRLDINKKSRERYKSDIKYKLSVALRNRINRLLKRRTKTSSVIKELGCDVSFLIKYLEKKFKPGMSWENWTRDGWHIDHIKPLSKFDLSRPEQFKRANHYTNLQPLWSSENIKKSNRI